MSDKFKLVGHAVVPCDDLLDWATWFEGADRKVASTTIGGVRVSTVFLGLYHSFGDGPPLLFETMVFGGKLNEEQARGSTWEEAEAQHRDLVNRVREVQGNA